jgi:hypothetical protein
MVKKLSEIIIDDCKNYANVFHSDDDDLFTLILEASKSYILSYTGLTIDQADLLSDLPICLLIICNEMYDNRVYMTDNFQMNQVVVNILSMHSKNYLGSYVDNDAQVNPL